ncbi:hypothetical protein [Mycobacterium intracellulare]|uniref:hypothetical protein n=1 Tax=Mycobacterium intracellulare TaxID=1767 RepID=UPI001EEDC114|nr:hypothetical protein [Mycobacterium intracellulare]MEE3755007.1 hypothetical protein [Mycobacterium intracellulare]
MTALLRDWNLELGKSAAGRRIAMERSRERASLLDGLVTEEDRLESGTEASVDADMEGASPQSGSPAVDDDLDQSGDWDDVTDDDYYADAFEDANDDQI